MAQRTNPVTIRFSVEDQERVLAALRAAGAAGEQMADKLDKSFKKAGQGAERLGAVGAAADSLRGQLDGFASRLGPVGAGLSALGPGGLAAAAGIGAVTLALGQAASAATRYADEIGKLVRQAEALGVSSRTIQAFGATAQQLGVGDTTEIIDLLNDFAGKLGEIQAGTSSLKDDLNTLSPGLGDAVAQATGLEQAFRLVAQAVAQAETRQQASAILAATMSDEAVKLQGVFQRLGADVDGMSSSLERAGRIIGSDVANEVARLDREIKAAAASVSADMQQAFLALLPIIARVVSAVAQVTGAIREALGGVAQLNVQSVQTVTGELSRVQAQIVDLRTNGRVTGTGRAGPIRVIEPESVAGPRGQTLTETGRLIAELQAREQQLVDELRRRATDGLSPWSRTPEGITPVGTGAAPPALPVPRPASANTADEDRREAQRAATQATRDAAAAAREQAQNEEAAARIRLELGDITGMYAIKQRELADLVKAGALTQAEATRALAAYRVELEQQAAAARQVQSLTPGIDRFVTEALNFRDRGDDLGVDILKGLSSTLVEVVKNSDKAGEAFARLGLRVVDMVLEMLMAQIVAQTLGRLLQSIGGPFMGFGGGGLGGGAGPLALPGATPMSTVGSVMAPVMLPTFHGGGTVGGPAPGYTAAFAADFSAWPRYHGGMGLRPGEVPAVLENGETVLSVVDTMIARGNGRALEAAGPTVVVQDNRVINANGAGPREIEELKRFIDDDNRSFEQRVRGVLVNEQLRRYK